MPLKALFLVLKRIKRCIAKKKYVDIVLSLLILPLILLVRKINDKRQNDLLLSKHDDIEPRHEKTGFLPLRKQRRRSAVQLLHS